MKCPICGSRLHPGSDRCHDCGCHVRTCAAPMDAPPPRRERRVRLRLLPLLGMLPVLFIIIFTTLISVSFRTEPETVHPEPEYAVTVPADRQSASLPAADESCFSVENGAVTFLPWCHDGSPIVQVPQSVEGQTVTALADGCFSGCAELTTIILPDTVTKIGDGAFAGCTRLRGLFLPEGILAVGTDAFAGCVALEALYVPSTARAIAAGCLSDCASLLYIFYNGSFQDWNALYSGYISPFTAAICLDGSYYHGTGR